MKLSDHPPLWGDSIISFDKSVRMITPPVEMHEPGIISLTFTDILYPLPKHYEKDPLGIRAHINAISSMIHSTSFSVQ